MADVVLDASAVLAYLQGEPGGLVALKAFPGAVLSAINYAEVITKLIEGGATPNYAQQVTDDLSLTVVGVDIMRGALAGRLHDRTRRRGVSLGDRFCLALAEELGLPVLTSDRRWMDLDLGIEITLIR